MRKLLCILVLAVFSFPLVSPIFALGTRFGASVLACCRRDGKHHCAGTMVKDNGILEQGIRIAAVPEKCPFGPLMTETAHRQCLAVPQSGPDVALFATDSSGIEQTDSMLRIARDRSRRKRGPPAGLAIS